MHLPSISVLVPAFNEEASIGAVLDTLAGLRPKTYRLQEVIVVNDASTDNTENIIRDFIQRDTSQIKYFLINHKTNTGKGSAIKTAMKKASSEFVIIQDADLEYDPTEIELLVKPIITANADVVFGTRFIGGQPHRKLFFWHSIGNRLLTFLSNAFNNLNLTDMETCYKLIRTKHIQHIQIKENRFGFEPEITAKLARIPEIKIYEVGISYYGRTYSEGKKINWKDGVRALYCIVRYNWLK